MGNRILNYVYLVHTKSKINDVVKLSSTKINNVHNIIDPGYISRDITQSERSDDTGVTITTKEALPRVLNLLIIRVYMIYSNV